MLVPTAVAPVCTAAGVNSYTLGSISTATIWPTAAGVFTTTRTYMGTGDTATWSGALTGHNTLSGNLVYGRHQYSIQLDDGCQSSTYALDILCNSNPTVVSPITVNVVQGQLINTTFFGQFAEAIDLTANELLFSKQSAGWPTWLNLNSEKGIIVGVPETVTGLVPVTVRATDKHGLFADLVININITPEFEPYRLPNTLENIKIRAGQSFEHQLDRRVWYDQDQRDIVMFASLPGRHWTDPQLPDWITYDEYNQIFTGKAPDYTEQTNLTLEITGYDVYEHYMTANFTIEIYPNAGCYAAYDPVNVACEEKTFCGYTILDDMFQDGDGDKVRVTILTPPQNNWLKFSTMNNSFFGYPEEAYNQFKLDFQGTDPYGAICYQSIYFEVLAAETNYTYIAIIVATIIAALVIVGFAIHAAFIGGKYQLFTTYITERNRVLDDVQTKINIRRTQKQKGHFKNQKKSGLDEYVNQKVARDHELERMNTTQTPLK